MSKDFLSILSHDYKVLLETGEYFDVILHTGQGNDEKDFKAHSLVLRARSTYFRVALSNNWAKTEGSIFIFNKPNISPKVFEIILNYLYGASIDLPENDVEFNIDVLRAAEELCLTDLLEYIEDHLLHNTDELLNHFALVYKFATQDEHYNDFNKLKEFCFNAMEREPSIVFDSTDFINIDQDSLISLLQMRYLIRREIELWDKIVEWSIAQVSSLSRIIENWTLEDFSIFGNIISPFIPYINFSLIRPNEFASKVRIFRRSFGDECYAKLLELHLSQLDVVTATLFQSSLDINSTLITPKHAALICSWLTNDEEYQSYNIPFEFNLLVRGSRDGFGPKIFHEKCDLKGPTITILKVLHSDELLGGYNPLNWEAHPEGVFHKTNKSFIFSLGQDDKHSSNLSLITIHSKVKETKKAIFQYEDYGPCFASDLALVGNYKRHWEGHCLKKNYENRISPGNYVFKASEYEVFQIVRKFL